MKSDYQLPSDGLATANYMPAHPNTGAVRVTLLSRARHVSGSRTQPAVQPAPGEEGAWYVWKCGSEGVRDALYRPPVWIPDGDQPAPEPLPSPADLARMAREQLRLRTPAIATSPTSVQLVNLPTWLWLSNGWAPMSATASVPGVSVTAVATPTSVTWSMGDGTTVTCDGPGTLFPVGGDPAAPSPDCGHTYRDSSASEPGDAYSVSATVHWTITWSGAGESGTFPDMTTTTSTAVRVAESQALNTGGD